MIPGVTLLFAYFISTRKGLWWFVIPCLLALGVFITMGFRYRIILLVGALGITFFSYRRIRPSLAVIVSAFAGLIVVMGYLNLSRRYYTGLDTEKLQAASVENAYSRGLDEARIFGITGAVVDYVPAKLPYAGTQPFVSTLLFPIPSTILPNKNSAQYLITTWKGIFGPVHWQGSAMLGFGEYYLAFGWGGVVVLCFITGWYLRKLWNWYDANSSDLFACCVYAVVVTFLYVVVSRGYLPQIVMLFFFSAYPIVFFYQRAKAKGGWRAIQSR
jgi:hypothetical protein